MKRKLYEKPTLDVVELKQSTMLLAGSVLKGQLGDPEDYLPEDNPFQFAPKLPGEPNPFSFMNSPVFNK